MTCRLRVYWVLFSVLCCLSAATAQITVQGGSQQKNVSPSPGAQKKYPSQINVEFDMTPEEAARLLASVDEVIAFDSKITGLPVRARVERKMTNRDELKQLAEKKMKESEVSDLLQRSSAVLAKFGLIPRDFDLQKFAIEGTVNELAGYYDPKVKTMYLMNWLPTSAQLPVMAHELDHALQDQNFQLENWMKTDDPAANGPTGGDSSEQKGARKAVAEGHATAVMMEYLLSKQGKSLAEMPPLSQDMMQAMVERIVTLPTTQGVPPALREEMAFPYIYGLRFVHEVLRRAGKAQAYSGIFKRPPGSTRQILEPATYLAHEKLAPLPMPAFDALLGEQYKKVESGSIGEFDCMVLTKLFGAPEDANQIPTDWRGDYFYAASRLPVDDNGKTQAAQPAKLEAKNVSLIFVSRWATAPGARRFAGFYRTAVAKRYSGAKPASGPGAQTPADVEDWETADGNVTVHIDGNLVLAVESFDEEMASRIMGAVIKADKR